jgi:hypothetical protein
VRVTVVPVDNVIIVDGDLRKPTAATYPSDVHAIQWYGSAGTIEYTNGPQKTISDEVAMGVYIALHAAAKERDEAPQPPYVPITKEQRIAQVLATQGKGKDRTLIQQVISFAEMVAAPLLATQYGVTLELAIMGIYARNKTYRECKDAEAEIRTIEVEP